jgi:2,4-diketo-3-deoxy-L-fuconate hydrolase
LQRSQFISLPTNPRSPPAPSISSTAAGAIEPSQEIDVKLLRYGAPGQEKPALLDADGTIRDLSSIVHDIAGETLRPQGLARLRDLDASRLPRVAAPVRLGACVAQVGKFVCIGLNYLDHATESGLQPPAEPVVFAKWTSAISGPHDAIEIPRGSLKTDWEVELGVIIGEPGRYIEEHDALSHVAGYCVVNDVSEREYQLERGGTWDKGKGFDTFGPLGPWLVTADEVPDPHALDLWLEVDGRRYQHGNTANMIFRLPRLISYLSQIMSLKSGDVISTGTPAGVGLGQKPPVYLRPGNVVRLGIDGLGEQRQEVR